MFKLNIKQGTTELPEVKATIDEALENAFEAIESCSELYPYAFKDAYSEVEYVRRDGFIPNSFNHGGGEITLFGTVNYMMGSGYMPASKLAAKEVNAAYEYNQKLALEELYPTKTREQLTDDESERVSDRADELGNDDTIMHQVRIMYHGSERGIHSATVQVAINWEFPYHRSSLPAWAGGGKTEDYIEVEVTWKKHESGVKKLSKAAIDGIKKLF